MRAMECDVLILSGPEGSAQSPEHMLCDSRGRDLCGQALPTSPEIQDVPSPSVHHAAQSCPVAHGHRPGKASGGSKDNIGLGKEKDTRAQSLSLMCGHMTAHTNRPLEAMVVGGYSCDRAAHPGHSIHQVGAGTSWEGGVDRDFWGLQSLGKGHRVIGQ